MGVLKRASVLDGADPIMQVPIDDINTSLPSVLG